jgi:hypothetical protein
MGSFAESMNEFRKLLQEGEIQEAYQGLMAYFRDLRAHFKSEHPTYPVSGSIYYGYMDMTYFAIFPEALKSRDLKIAIVFVYETFRFEVWLSGANRDVQAKYWRLVKDSGWDRYHLASDPRKEDYVIGHVLAADPDFGDLQKLTKRIEGGTLAFIREVEGFLSAQ